MASEVQVMTRAILESKYPGAHTEIHPDLYWYVQRGQAGAGVIATPPHEDNLGQGLFTVNVPLAVDVPLTNELFRHVACMGRWISVGRCYVALKGDTGLGVVTAEECLPGTLISSENRAGLQFAINLIHSMLNMFDGDVGSTIRSSFGGRAIDPNSEMSVPLAVSLE